MLMTPPAPEYAANAPIRNQSAPGGMKSEAAARGVEAEEARAADAQPAGERRRGTTAASVAQDAEHEHPVEDLERALDAASASSRISTQVR